MRSDIVDVVAVLPGTPAQSGPRATESGAGSRNQIDKALARWSRRFARERLFVLAPRALAFALSLAALIALVIAVSGSRLTLAVALWLLVPPLVGLAIVLARSWRDPSPPEVARVLDRDLALDERLGTAIEIAGAELAVDGLAALVLAEADAVLATSHLSGARPTHRSAQRAWLVAAAAALTISGLLILISGRGESLGPRGLAAVTSAGHRAGPTSVANGGGAKHARPITGRTRNIGPDDRRATTLSLKSGGRNAALSVVTRPQSSTPGGRLPLGGGNERTPAGAFGRSGSQTGGLGTNAGARRASGGAGGSSSAEASTHSLGSSRGDRAGSSRHAAGRGHATNPHRAGAGSRTGKFNANRTPSSAASGKAQPSGASATHAAGYTKFPSAHSAVRTGRARTGQGRSAGSGAGAGSGGNPLGPRQAKGLPSGFAGRLPIKSGSTAARNRTGPKTGNPTGRSGGKGPARSATENSRGSATAVTFPYIPPSADIGPADSALLQHYFSPVQTVSGRW